MGTKLEQMIKKYHYRLELLRSIIPLVILGIQIAILVKIY
jgi:hypothetical protein